MNIISHQSPNQTLICLNTKKERKVNKDKYLNLLLILADHYSKPFDYYFPHHYYQLDYSKASDKDDY